MQWTFHDALSVLTSSAPSVYFIKALSLNIHENFSFPLFKFVFHLFTCDITNIIYALPISILTCTNSTDTPKGESK